MRWLDKKKKTTEKIPYQTVCLKGKTYPGRFDTRKMFAALDIKNSLKDKSFIDLGCNRGGLVFLAEDCGASTSVGVDISEKSIGEARGIANEMASRSEFYCASIQNFAPKMDSYDFVVCTAVFRHLYADLLKEVRTNITKPRGFLVLDSLDTLIRQEVGDPPSVVNRFNEIIEAMLSAARERFICSYNDESGLIHRRKDEVLDYFRGRTDRIENLEIYLYDYNNPKFVIVDAHLSSTIESQTQDPDDPG